VFVGTRAVPLTKLMRSAGLQGGSDSLSRSIDSSSGDANRIPWMVRGTSRSSFHGSRQSESTVDLQLLTLRHEAGPLVAGRRAAGDGIRTRFRYMLIVDIIIWRKDGKSCCYLPMGIPADGYRPLIAPLSGGDACRSWGEMAVEIVPLPESPHFAIFQRHF
jgi:hypothetical protein